MQNTSHISYKELRKVSPEATRKAVLEYFLSAQVEKTTGGNIANAAKVFGINRPVVYDILRKAKEGNLKDRAKVPKNQPRRRGSWKIWSWRLKTKQIMVPRESANTP